MDLLIEKRKFLQSYRTNTDFIEGIEVNTEENSMTIKNNLLNSPTNTTKVFLGIPHLRYDATTNRIVAGKAVETTLNSLYLRDQHKMSSGAHELFCISQGDKFPNTYVYHHFVHSLLSNKQYELGRPQLSFL